MYGNLSSNLQKVKEIIARHSDVNIREFSIAGSSVGAAIIYADGLADKDMIDQHILKALMNDVGEETVTCSLLINKVITVSQITVTHEIEEMIRKVLTGQTALLVDGMPEMLIIGTMLSKSRNIEEPISEALVRGPRTGFNETLSDNTALLRRHGENASLSMVSMKVGKRASKDLIIAYMEDIADSNLVEEVKRRISKIDIDDLPESGYVEQLIEDNFLSPFPQVQSTERPDRVIAALLEGRVAILLDGTPFALIVPVTFSMLLQSPEDYYERWLSGSLLRVLRFAAALISLLTPSLYISFISFHPGLIPTKLAVSIMATRVGVPFSSLVEALIMEIAIEILREAGLRLPKPIGPAMGIVGGLIIGEAAVQAGIVSPILVIVVAVTAISSFTIPQYSVGIALRMLRFIAMFCAAAFGLYGVILFFLMLCVHVVKLKSFGVPYASPAVPYRLNDWKDFILRMPLPMMKRRPKMLKTKDPIRKG